MDHWTRIFILPKSFQVFSLLTYTIVILINCPAIIVNLGQTPVQKPPIFLHLYRTKPGRFNPCTRMSSFRLNGHLLSNT